MKRGRGWFDPVSLFWDLERHDEICRDRAVTIAPRKERLNTRDDAEARHLCRRTSTRAAQRLGLGLAFAALAFLWWHLSGGNPDLLAQAREALHRGRAGTALHLVNEAVAQRPHDLRATALKEEILTRIGRLDATPVPPATMDRAALDDARRLLSSGEPARAREVLEPILSGAHRQEALWLMSRAFLQESNVDRARSVLSESEPTPADPTRPEPAPFLGSASCEACHAEIYRSQSRSRHARTIRYGDGLASVAFPERDVVDPGQLEARHGFEQRADGKRFIRSTAGGAEYRALLQYAVGSGDRGVSFVVRDSARQPRLARLSLFQHDSLVDLTPMAPQKTRDDSELQGLLIHDTLADCLGCHSTRVDVDSQGVQIPVDNGISCERCHGPGGHHVTAVAGKLDDLAIARPKVATAAQIVSLCGQCHQPPRGATLPPGDPTIIRQQSLTMPRSRCYTESRGALSCVTCHDPHRDAETKPSFYEKTCMGCHEPEPARGSRDGAGTGGPCPVEPTRDCLNCHMPKVENPLEHTSFTDHYIRIHGKETSRDGG